MTRFLIALVVTVGLISVAEARGGNGGHAGGGHHGGNGVNGGHGAVESHSMGHFAEAARSSKSVGTGSNPSSHYVSGYTRKNGTYVSGYYATNPNSSRSDNYSAYGNYNPHTGYYY